MSEANYNGRQPNNTSYIKTFVEGTEPAFWTNGNLYIDSSNIEVVTTTDIDNVYIPGDLYVGGKIINISNSNFLQDLISESIKPLITEINNLQKQVDDLNSKLNAK